jgi:hypothetical protein
VSSIRLSRRGVLGALAAVGASSLLPRFAVADNGAPKRLIVIFTPNGTIADAWKPTGSETSFTLGPILQPLQPFQNRLLVVDNIDVLSAHQGPGDDHMKGMGHMLTGTELLSGTTQGGAGTPAGFAGGISIDQRIANDVGGNTRFKSLEFGAAVRDSDIWSRMIYSGPNQPIPPMEDPAKAYARLFAGTNLTPAQLQRLLNRRKSVLDHASGTLDSLQKNMGGDDRTRVQAHLDSIRQIESQLLAKTQACVPPTVGTLDLNKPENYEAIGRLQMDMIVAAMACDQTRVASMQFSRSVSQMTFPSLGISEGHHDLSHMGDSDTVAKDKLIAINTYYAKQVAYLLGKLDAVKETNGTLLDNSLVLWVNELSKGNAHSHAPLPIVIAGKCGGALRTGRFLQYAKAQPHNNLLVSVANAMGVGLTTFGNPAYCTGALSNFA